MPPSTSLSLRERDLAPCCALIIIFCVCQLLDVRVRSNFVLAAKKERLNFSPLLCNLYQKAADLVHLIESGPTAHQKQRAYPL